MTSSRWCFTLNNYSDDDEQGTADFLSSGDCVYGIYGREIGETGTPHLQGFVILRTPQRLSYLRNNLSSRAHYERARGSSESASNYCKKDGDFTEFGDLPSRQGKRNDIDELIAWSDAFTEERGRPPTSPDIAKHKPHAYLKYPRFRALCAQRAPRRRLEFSDPRDWQLELEQRIAEPADSRTIDFVVDPEGGKGKTWFCRYMLYAHEGTQVLGVGKKADIAYIIDESNWVFLFNVGRGQMEYLSYPLLEALKDQMVLSTKYSGLTKIWNKPVHVVVLGNEYPDMNKLTADRYNVIEV